MLMHRWSPPSQMIPITSLDNNSTSDTQRMRLRCCKVIIFALILLVLISFSIVYTLQKESLFNEEYKRKQQDEFHQRQQLLFDTYTQDISSTFLQITGNNHTDEKFLRHIQSKTLMILRDLEVKRKKDVLLFLYERNLIQNNRLNLYGADLNNVELACPHNFHRFNIKGVLWSNAKFINCHLTSATFDYTYLINARFINSTLRAASFIEAKLDHSYFLQTIIMNNNFHGASLIQADFLQADVVQGNHFSNADLYQAKLTNGQLEGKQVSTIKNHYFHARFPNGSFGSLTPEENLIINGNAEMECFLNEQTTWTTIDPNTVLSAEKFENITNENVTMNVINWGNCSFAISGKTRVYQDIVLLSYSILIDTHNAAISFMGFASCDKSYFQIHMYRSDNILHESIIYRKIEKVIEPYNEKSMDPYGGPRHLLRAHTRRIQIDFGVETPEDYIKCHFDNITLTIDQMKTL
ncbi:unnamed protein product [Rotaria magnacalcarata]|uniref:Pentapeptide repeat-containing protein n=4 Tax=Rotaria magnacalcarata TaxID=392030 RepID=A0A816NDV4_9BILA|nr:unnamed protein product [Rotaria magnacalcarata]